MKNVKEEKNILTLSIESVNSYGCGVAHAPDGRVMFVSGAVGGDVVEAQVIKAAKTYSVCRLVSLVSPSPDRETVPFCSAPNACGGCTYRHIKYECELETKRLTVLDAMRRASLQGITVAPVLSTGAERGGYRNKVIYPVVSTKAGMRFGYFAQGSHKVIPHDSCSLSHPDFDAIASRVVRLMDEHGISAYDEETGRGLLRHIYMRRGINADGKGEILLCLVINGRSLPHGKEIAETLVSEFSSIVGVLLNVNEEKTNAVLGKRFITLLGRDYIFDTLLKKSFRIHPAAFWQVNREGAELLYSTAYALGLSEGCDTLIDLYCGIGSIGLCAAEKAGRLFGIEIVPEAVDCAKENAELNGVKNAEFLCADASDSERYIAEILNRYPDATVIVDPPRKGCGEKLMRFLADMNVKKVLYISCNPYSLATDMKVLTDEGYAASEVVPVDMFPRTSHVETVVCLSRQTDVHKMKLNPEPFEKIKGGQKTIELRLYDEKRQKIKSGDSIVFTNVCSGEKLRATVKNLHCFESFEELYRSLPLLKCGYTPEDIDGASPSDMGQYYSLEEQKKYGVVGIELC